MLDSPPPNSLSAEIALADTLSEQHKNVDARTLQALTNLGNLCVKRDSLNAELQRIKQNIQVNIDQLTEDFPLLSKESRELALPYVLSGYHKNFLKNKELAKILSVKVDLSKIDRFLAEFGSSPKVEEFASLFVRFDSSNFKEALNIILMFSQGFIDKGELFYYLTEYENISPEDAKLMNEILGELYKKYKTDKRDYNLRLKIRKEIEEKWKKAHTK